MLHAIAIRLENFTPSLPFSSLRSHTVGCIASVRGHVVRIGPSKPLIISALFYIAFTRIAIRKRLKYRGTVLRLQNGRTLGSNAKSDNAHLYRIQEEISSETTWKNNRPAETTANSLLDIELTGDLVGNYFPGNIVEVVGVIKASESQSDSAFSHKFLYTIYMDAVSINVLNKKYESHTSREYNNVSFIHLISIIYRCLELYLEPNRFYLAAASMFPKVVGRNYAKAGLLLSILGGVSIYDECRALKRRGNIHCLLVGDPGVGKSLFLRSICNPLYGNYFFSGGSITASGLTAAVVRESGSNEFNLEAGALVLSSGGVCCIDELDKVSAIEQEAFLEVMEQQVVSVAKAGIISTLNARTTVICASNPINGKFNSKKSLSENIKLSQPLLSRFDLIFVMVDNPLGDHDETISNHLLKRVGSAHIY
ncbi:DNA replication licensing factor family protein [Theileria equi strain WA]|uniref:DNA helicase n=1 Tax=Theileria equi strain WA TaxID=1537102 RepID=L1LEJ3_THEEQ|nr:DNA replication licensing factor family protein [Theileria equi strain WA]EKX73704.1 DNA replication licensing factor family protein [Theileria equi strain WA]|eukprot:XP_004833156.1 DNA replication licensing factor family protein [Theileria equi strain WA]